MSDLLAGLLATPRLYPQNFDPAGDSMFLMEMSEVDYRRASFLDDRVLSAATRGQWVSGDAVARALPAPAAARPLHFIFHSGHVGSTLLSRLLDETGKVLSLREPLPLRTFAVAFDAPVGEVGPRLEARLETFLRLWERGFAATEAVILKATSSAARLAPRLLTARPAARAVCLNLSSESYLAALLRGPNSAVDLSAHGSERTGRLERRLGAPPPPPAPPPAAARLSRRACRPELARRAPHPGRDRQDVRRARPRGRFRGVPAHDRTVARPDPGALWPRHRRRKACGDHRKRGAVALFEGARARVFAGLARRDHGAGAHGARR